MTKKEAIEWLKRIEERYIRGFNTFDAPRKEALHMAIEALDENAEPKWIPVSERLPEDGTYLCWEQQGFIYVDSYCGGKWELEERCYSKCVAWMPLPKPYEVTE